MKRKKQSERSRWRWRGKILKCNTISVTWTNEQVNAMTGRFKKVKEHDYTDSCYHGPEYGYCTRYRCTLCGETVHCFPGLCGYWEFHCDQCPPNGQTIHKCTQ